MRVRSVRERKVGQPCASGSAQAARRGRRAAFSAARAPRSGTGTGSPHSGLGMAVWRQGGAAGGLRPASGGAAPARPGVRPGGFVFDDRVLLGCQRVGLTLSGRELNTAARTTADHMAGRRPLLFLTNCPDDSKPPIILIKGRFSNHMGFAIIRAGVEGWQAREHTEGL